MSSSVDKKFSILGEEPKDTGNVAWLIMFFLGVGNLFPWNAFITASGYYANRFCGTSFEDNFENYFSFMFTACQTAGLALSVVYQDKFTFQQKIAYPLMLYSVVFLLTTALVGVTDMDGNALFYVTSLCACLCGLCGAMLSSGLYGLAAMLPPTYTAAVMSGSGMAGFVVSVAGLLTTAAAKSLVTCDDEESTTDSCKQEISYSALAYFLIATLVLVANVLSFTVLKRLPIVRYYIARAIGDHEDVYNPLVESSDLPEGSAKREAENVTFFAGSEEEIENSVAKKTVDDRPFLTRFWTVYKKLWISSLSVMFTFTVTIAIFPSLIVLVQSTEYCKSSNRFSNDLFVPFMFLLFNLCDWIGRASGEWYTLGLTSTNIWIFALLRVIFFPLFLLSNVANSQLPVVFNNDACPILFMIGLALSNGFLSTRCMIQGATAVDPKESGMAGTIMIFSLTVGLLCGACSSFIVVTISQGSV
jgi:equilibrative nucleoside transporter 1/2/3